MQKEIWALWVDDSKTNRMIGAKMLESMANPSFDIKVQIAENGEQCIQLCREQRFQVIFMDIEMPGLSGIETANFLRQEKLSFAPIFAVSGHDKPQILEACHSALINGFLSKPLKQDKLESVFKQLFHYQASS